MTQGSGPKPPGPPPGGPYPQQQWPQQPQQQNWQQPGQPQQWPPPQPQNWQQPPPQQWQQPQVQPPPQPQNWQQPPPQQWQQPPPQAMAAPGQPLVFRMHSGARTAMNIVGGLLILLFVTIPFAIYIFVRTAGARIEITGDQLILRNLTSKRWKLASLRRLGILAVPVYARGIGGILARKKVGGDKAIHLCSIDDRGKKSTLLVSMYERHPEIIQHVANVTRLPVEELQVGAFGPKWPG